MKKLVIAEKPKAAKALVDGLYNKNFKFVEPYKKFKAPQAKVGYYEADDIIITYAKGHLLRLKTIEEYLGLPASPRNYDCLPYVPEKFELIVSDDEWYKEQFKVLKDLFNRKDISEVVHFGDPDNEGELIIREILTYFGNTLPVKRLWCNSMVPDVVADAYYNLEDDRKYTNIYYQALARQQFDYMWGINISRFLTKKANSIIPAGNTNTNFPAGRVLVPIVKYIYDRDQEIENFSSTTSYGIDATIKKDNWSSKISNSTPEILFSEKEKADADFLAKDMNTFDKVVTNYEETEKNLKPKKLFNLTSFQSKFNKEYGYDLKTALNTLQKLYEKGFITYPRTSVEYLNKKESKELEKVIVKLTAAGHNIKFHHKSSVFNDEKCVGGHTALTITTKIPTNKDVSDMTEVEKQAYSMIFNRTLSNFCDDAKIIESKAEITCGKYVFKITGNKLIDEGFMIYEKRNIKNEIPKFEIGESVDMTFEVAKRETSPPPKITPSSLLAFLSNPYTKELKKINKEDDAEYYKLLKEGATLGTESTTASIVENAQKYGYIVLKRKSFSITEKGILFIKLLDTFDINLYKEKNIEMNKTIIAIGNKAYSLEENKQKVKSELKDIFEHNQNITVTIDTNLFDDSIGNCPRCGSPVIEKANSFQCTNKDCKFFIYKQDKYFKSFGKSITRSIAKSLLRKKKVQLNRCKSKSGKEYSIIINVDYSGEYPHYSTCFPEPKKKQRKE